MMKLRYLKAEVIRVTIDKKDYTFENGGEYDLPENSYVSGLLKKGYFEKVEPKKTKE